MRTATGEKRKDNITGWEFLGHICWSPDNYASLSARWEEVENIYNVAANSNFPHQHR